MSSTHTKEILGFNGFSGYYGSLAAGYGGFDWSSIDYLNATYWENQKTNWCDTGYQNVIGGAGEGYVYKVGELQSSNLKESFSLTSMVAASAWETNQPWTFNTYTFSKGNFTHKASDAIFIGQTAQKINFAKISGGKTDFHNIAAVTISAGYGGPGSSCTYGAGTYGFQLAFDNLRIKWNGAIPDGRNAGADQRGHVAHPHHQAAHLAAQMTELSHLASGTGHSAASGHHADAGYDTQLLSLPGHDSGGLTTQFHIPVEHFGP